MIDNTEDVRAGLPSASSMDRLYHCPGSFAAEKGLPELANKQPVRDSGTAIHDAQATGDNSDLELSDKEVSQRISKIEQAVVGDWCQEFDLSVGAPDRERRYWIRNRQTLDPVSSAQPDVVYLEFNDAKYDSNAHPRFAKEATHAIVLNYKTGYADLTPSELNWQCRTEVIATWHEYPQVTQIRGAILASRLYDKFDATDYDLADLQRIERELFHILWRAEQPDAPRVPGQWCRYCRARGTCKEAAVFAMAFSTIVPKLKDPLAIVEAVAKMAPSELAYVHQRSALANAIFDAVEQRLKALPAAELEAVGYRMADGNRIIKFTNITAAMARLLNVMTPEQRAECISISLPKASKIVAAEKSIPEKKARAVVEETLGDSFTETKGNPKLKTL